MKMTKTVNIFLPFTSIFAYLLEPLSVLNRVFLVRFVFYSFVDYFVYLREYFVVMFRVKII